jgi:putative membrane-bound dehydrogenase-like protein
MTRQNCRTSQTRPTRPTERRNDTLLSRAFTATLIAFTSFSAVAGPEESNDHPPSHVLESFRFADPTLQIELVAAEPDVIDPVAIAWDERGRMFVAEMRDYPVGPVAGTVRMLEDVDGDGRYEKSTLFAEGLPFPNSVLPWKGGILVSAAPDILYLKDTNEDGKADERRVILTGFVEGNQQLRVNSLHFGLDGWVYAANGRSDGVVRRPDDPPEKAVPLRRHDLRFKPDTGEFDPIAGFSQFGLCHDDWGNRFLSWNTVPIRHVVMEERYLTRNPLLAATNVEAIIIDSTETGRIFPISPPQKRYNRESVEFFNASCGLTLYRGDALPEFEGNAFVCEPLTSLVHRRILERSGATFVAKRGEIDKEFLASTDGWFRPVNLATGPDGALYVVDFARKWVEHPDFVPKEFRDEIDFRTGDDLGRIWRVRKKDAALPPFTKLADAASDKLIEHLSNENGWIRDTAQRLLLETPENIPTEGLRAIISESKSDKARVHALYVIAGTDKFDTGLLASALEDKSSHVRAAALRLAGSHASEPEKLARRIEKSARDSDPQVRFQAVLAAGFLPPATRIDILKNAAADSRDPWVRLAILASASPDAGNLFGPIWNDGTSGPAVDGRMELLAQLAELSGASEKRDFARTMLDDLSTAQFTPVHLAVMVGLSKGLERRGSTLETVWKESHPNVAITQVFSKHIETVLNDATAPHDSRVLAVALVSRGLAPEGVATLPEMVTGDVPEELRQSAISALVTMDRTDLLHQLFDQWASLPVTTRRLIVQASLATQKAAIELLRAIEQEKVGKIELDTQVRETLAKYPDTAVKEHFTKLFANDKPRNRLEIVAAYSETLALKGDSSRGAEVFAQNCMPCHMYQGKGNRVGPDLSGAASRSKEKLLSDILDPNAEVAPDFVAYTAVTKDLDVVTGVLAGETAANITFRQAQGVEQTIARDNLQELRASMLTLMPEGFESAVDRQGMADLIEYLRNSNGAPLPPK